MTYLGGPIDVTEEVEKFSDDRAVLAFERAEREFGNCVADYESDEFMEEFARQLCHMAADDALTSLLRKGVVKVTRIEDNGELVYALTDKAKEAFDNE